MVVIDILLVQINYHFSRTNWQVLFRTLILYIYIYIPQRHEVVRWNNSDIGNTEIQIQSWLTKPNTWLPGGYLSAGWNCCLYAIFHYPNSLHCACITPKNSARYVAMNRFCSMQEMHWKLDAFSCCSIFNLWYLNYFIFNVEYWLCKISN